MMFTKEFISDQTGFDAGEKFESEAEVRNYFTRENLESMFGGHCDADPEALAAIADAVITNRWHCADWFGVEFIGEKPRALDILAELGGCRSCEFLGAYEHQGHPGSADWMVRLYSITTGDGYVTCVAATNGESVWLSDMGSREEAEYIFENYGIK